MSGDVPASRFGLREESLLVSYVIKKVLRNRVTQCQCIQYISQKSGFFYMCVADFMIVLVLLFVFFPFFKKTETPQSRRNG
jgi:hypothetical protein